MNAITLAAGEGARLRPLTRTRPKPMLPIGTNPSSNTFWRLPTRPVSRSSSSSSATSENGFRTTSATVTTGVSTSSTSSKRHS